MKPINDLVGLLIYHLQNLYASENQQLQDLKVFIEKAKNGSLKKALEYHYEITEAQKIRLEQIPQLIKEQIIDIAVEPLNTDYVSKGMKGLMDEAIEILDNALPESVVDAAIIACLQKIEHYEITTYGTAYAYASELKLTKVEALLKEALNEEYDADDLLTALATASLNKKAEPQDLKLANERQAVTDEEPTTEVYTSGSNTDEAEEGSSTRTVQSPGGRAGTSHRRYADGESRGH
jgi:ferritin-like metal-binding protein YciE